MWVFLSPDSAMGAGQDHRALLRGMVTGMYMRSVMFHDRFRCRFLPKVSPAHCPSLTSPETFSSIALASRPVDRYISQLFLTHLRGSRLSPRVPSSSPGLSRDSRIPLLHTIQISHLLPTKLIPRVYSWLYVQCFPDHDGCVRVVVLHCWVGACEE
jgi:hypothetical protein